MLPPVNERPTAGTRGERLASQHDGGTQLLTPSDVSEPSFTSLPEIWTPSSETRLHKSSRCSCHMCHAVAAFLPARTPSVTHKICPGTETRGDLGVATYLCEGTQGASDYICIRQFGPLAVDLGLTTAAGLSCLIVKQPCTIRQSTYWSLWAWPTCRRPQTAYGSRQPYAKHALLSTRTRPGFHCTYVARHIRLPTIKGSLWYI